MNKRTRRRESLGRGTHLLALSLLVSLLSHCTSERWIQGRWLLISEEGKPGVCHEFNKDRTFTVYTTITCTGKKDTVLSGKWELKEDSKLAILRYNERKAQLALVTDRQEQSFVSRGALAGTFFKLKQQTPQTLVTQLEAKGVVKIKTLPPAEGCQQLGLSLKEIKQLPKETAPRMLRFKDQMLQYHGRAASGNSHVEKVVYALNNDEVEWMALHLAPSAFQPPGPQARLEALLGRPVDAAATGSGEKRQHIAMWRAYCAKLGHATNADVDVTLFATTGQRRGTVYVSENVVSSLWEELKNMANDPSAQHTEEEEEGTTPTPPTTTPPAPSSSPPPNASKLKKALPAKRSPSTVPPAGISEEGDDDL